MSQLARQEVLAKRRERYGRAGQAHKTKIITERVERVGYHRQAAIRALRPRPVVRALYVPGRPQGLRPGQVAAPAQGHLAGGAPTLRAAAQSRSARRAGGLRARPSPAGRRPAAGVAGRQSRHAGSAVETGARATSPPRHHPARDAAATPDSTPHRLERACSRLSGSGLGGDGRRGAGWPARLEVRRGGHSHPLERAARAAQPRRSGDFMGDWRCRGKPALPVRATVPSVTPRTGAVAAKRGLARPASSCIEIAWRIRATQPAHRGRGEAGFTGRAFADHCQRTADYRRRSTAHEPGSRAQFRCVQPHCHRRLQRQGRLVGLCRSQKDASSRPWRRRVRGQGFGVHGQAFRGVAGQSIHAGHEAPEGTGLGCANQLGDGALLVWSFQPKCRHGRWVPSIQLPPALLGSGACRVQ